MDFNFTPTYLNTQKAITQICSAYPFVKNEIIGFSHCRRKINALTVGSEENRVLFCAAFHGMESITTLILLKFFESCCQSVVNDSVLYKEKAVSELSDLGLCCVFCVNPDGVEIARRGSKSAMPFKLMIDAVTADTSRWQSNAAGVDLNHNFDAGWEALKALELKNGIKRPAATRFGGNRPFSEPETKALKKFCEKNNFARAVAFHSQGREIYYDFGESTPKESLDFAKELALLCDYTVSKPEGLAVGGGFKDWFIERFSRPAYTVEIGLGENPLPFSDFPEEYDRIYKMLCLAAAGK